MRVVFLGSPSAAVPTLRALIEAGHEVPLVVSRSDRRRGRGTQLSPTPVKEFALSQGIEVTTDPDRAARVSADLGVVVAFGRIIREPLLGSMPLINVHFSLLPRWRGAAPVERAILAGDEVSGVSIMDIEAGLDTGAVYSRAETPIAPGETSDQLTDRLAQLGADLLVGTLSGGLPRPLAQTGEAVTAEKLTSRDRHLDWSRSSEELERVVRIGRAWSIFRGRRLLVSEARVIRAGSPAEAVGAGSLDRFGEIQGLEVLTGSGRLRLLRVQPEGKGQVSAEEWVRGARPVAGEKLGP